MDINDIYSDYDLCFIYPLTAMSLVQNGVIFIATSLYTSKSFFASRWYNVLPMMASLFCLLSTFCDQINYQENEGPIFILINMSSWITDYLSRTCLLTFAYSRTLTLFADAKLSFRLYILVLGFSTAATGVVLYGAYYNRVEAEPLYALCYCIVDLVAICFDVYLCQVLYNRLNMAGKIISFSSISKPCSTLIVAALLLLLTTVLFQLGLDDSYVYWNLFLQSRILCVQIFNVLVINQVSELIKSNKFTESSEQKSVNTQFQITYTNMKPIYNSRAKASVSVKPNPNDSRDSKHSIFLQ